MYANVCKRMHTRCIKKGENKIMEEAIKIEVSDKTGNKVIAEFVMGTKDTVRIDVNGKCVVSVEWSELQAVFIRALDMWHDEEKEGE